MHQLIPGGQINWDGLRAMKLERQVRRWRTEGKVKGRLVANVMWFDVDQIIVAMNKVPFAKPTKEAVR